ncbi:MAG: glycosyltransferase family 2 protein [Candidatus Pacebacteria bacterium]|nr:glycosyltransferase family 2 protein [Candidatus Paceibacterota bacterium]
MKKTTSTFSIVIPCLNEEKYLPLLLEDLSNQTNRDFEVIVIDGNSDDKTVEKANSFSDKFPLIVKVVKKRNVSLQRNTGGALAKNEWIIFMDADNRLPAAFLDGIRYRLAEHPETDLFSTWTATSSSGKNDKTWANFFNLTLEIQTRLNKPIGVGALIGINKKHFSQYQFPEEEKFLEDGYLVQSAANDGLSYKLFQYPQFVFSLRRVKKFGSVKLLFSVIQHHVKFWTGGSLSDDSVSKDYPMLGGAYYDQLPSPERSMLKRSQEFIRTASAEQRIEVRKIVKRFFDSEE